MSWWQDLTREEFYREVSKRFELNKPDSPRRGMPKVISKVHASRGGKSAKREYRPWQKKSA